MLRIATLSIAALGGLSPFSGKTNVDWRLGIFVGLVFSAFFSYTIKFQWPRTGADFSQPWDPKAPFWPANKYPIRSWMHSAICFEVLGVVGRTREGLLGDNADFVGSPNSVYECYITISAILLITVVWWGRQLNKGTA